MGAKSKPKASNTPKKTSDTISDGFLAEEGGKDDEEDEEDWE